MKHPLFNQPEANLSPQEEVEITNELANAYRQNELGGKRPEFQRIANNIQKQFLNEIKARETTTADGGIKP